MTVYEMVNREFADLPISTMRYTQDIPINVSNHWHAAVEISFNVLSLMNKISLDSSVIIST